MPSDNLDESPYDEIMGQAKAFLVLTLDTKNPIEIGSFVSEFTSVASQYGKFVKERHPDLVSEAHIFVKQVKKGSIIVEMIPFLPTIFGADGVVGTQINAINEFVRAYGGKLEPIRKKMARLTMQRGLISGIFWELSRLWPSIQMGSYRLKRQCIRTASANKALRFILQRKRPCGRHTTSRPISAPSSGVIMPILSGF